MSQSAVDAYPRAWPLVETGWPCLVPLEKGWSIGSMPSEPLYSYQDRHCVSQFPMVLSPAANQYVSDACTLEQWDQSVEQFLAQMGLTEATDAFGDSLGS